MFSNEVTKSNIPPNFLNSILTNSSLYQMFKDDFLENTTYFQGIEKDEYLKGMLSSIEETLFSRNIFHIYNPNMEELDILTEGKLRYIRNFYDDFLLPEFKSDSANVLKTRLFRGLVFARDNDLYAKDTKEFNELYDYVFGESLNYDEICEELLKDIFDTLASDDPLGIVEYTKLSNYVKNNTSGYVDMKVVTSMLKRHVYKTNHIFDSKVVEALVQSTLKSYMDEYQFSASIEFCDALESGALSECDFDTNTIYMSRGLVDSFLSLNYIELYEHLFYEMDLLKSHYLLSKNEVNLRTLNAIMNLVIAGVDLSKPFDVSLFKDCDTDLKSSSFIKALKFFSSIGISLFTNYINAKSRDMDIDFDIEKTVYSNKESSLDQRFDLAIKKLENRKDIVNRYSVLDAIYNMDGKRKSTLEIIKELFDEEREFLTDYLHSRIIEPEAIIDDVQILAKEKRNDEMGAFIEGELKYIFVDSFIYSVNSYIKLMELKGNKLEEYLDKLSIKVSSLKDTPLTHRFIDEGKLVIEEVKERS